MGQSFIESAVDRIGDRRHKEALRILGRGIRSMPPGWTPRKREGEWLRCAFWSAQEFAEFVRCHPEERDVQWTSPSFAKAWYWVAHCEYELGRAGEAERAIRQSIQLEPDHPEALCELGFFQQERDEWEAALATYRQAETARPWLTSDQRGLALRGQGFCLIELWEFDSAAQALLESLRHEPGNEIGLSELAYLQRRREEVEHHQRLAPDERLRFYPPPSTDTREMVAFARESPPLSGARAVGKRNFERLRRAYAASGWLGFEGVFVSLYPARDLATQQRKAALLRDPVFRGSGVTDLLRGDSGRGQGKAHPRLKGRLQ
jgi:tetratricopeptide (TPR) repeat protein